MQNKTKSSLKKDRKHHSSFLESARKIDVAALAANLDKLWELLDDTDLHLDIDFGVLFACTK